MVGGGGGTVKVAVVVAALTGCFWRTYGQALATHTDLLVALARKGADLVASGRFTAESMPELTYPLERAQAYARNAAAHADGERPGSLAAFEELIERYRAFVNALDRVRRAESGEAARASLSPPLAAVEAAAETVRTALRGEGRV